MSRKTTKAPDSTPEENRTGSAGKAVAVGLAVLAIVGIAAWILLGGGHGAPVAGESPERAAALASAQAPSRGEPAAPVHVVEFLDPACETCALFYPIVHDYQLQNPGRIRLSTRHVAFHQGSEYAVRVLEAARLQDKYWETLEALLGRQAQWAPNHVAQPDLIVQTVSAVGLNLERLMADIDSPAVSQRLAQDAADAATLKVTATPEYFVNGRPLPEFGEAQLRALIEDELSRHP